MNLSQPQIYDSEKMVMNDHNSSRFDGAGNDTLGNTTGNHPPGLDPPIFMSASGMHQPIVTNAGTVIAPQPVVVSPIAVPPERQHSGGNYKIALWNFFIILIFEILMIFFYGFFVRFRDTELPNFYPMFQDVNVMTFLGFGFLMSYLKFYSWSAIGHSFYLAAISVQLHPLLSAFWGRTFHNDWGSKIYLDSRNLTAAAFSACSVLISFGGLIGHASIVQLVVMTLINVLLYSLVEGIIFEVLFGEDIGGTVGIHLFGATFGIFCTYLFLGNHPNPKFAPKNTSSYTSNITAFIGCLFLWMYWPSFNGALADNDVERIKAVGNTYFSIAASAVTTFAISPLLNRGKLNAEEILNATLAGGVIIGSSCNWIQCPAFSVGIGCIAGFVATFGFNRISHYLHRKGLYDTVGITNLHFFTAVIGAFFSAIICAIYYDRDRRSSSR